MKKYNFDVIHDRKNTSSIKYDFGMERKGRDDLLPLWVADMDFKLPDEIIGDIVKRTEHGIFGYTDPDASYKAAVRGWFSKRHGFEIRDEWNIVEPGVVYSIATAIRAFTNEGDHIIIQQPVYYPFEEMIRLNNRKVVNNQLIYHNGRYEIDFDDFENKIRENDVKMYILCSPHNPVGRVWTREELTRVGDICLKYNVYLFADEIHSDFVYKPHKHTSFMTLGDKYTKRLVLGTSPSKTFNIAGLQVANIIIPDEEMRRKYKLQNAAAGYSQGNVLGMTATTSVYTKGEEYLEELLDYLSGNISYVRDFLNEKLPQIHLVEPEGTYLLWLDFSEYISDHKELEKLIVDEARLWLDPGVIFGRQTALFERINIACPRQILMGAMNRLYDAVTARNMVNAKA